MDYDWTDVLLFVYDEFTQEPINSPILANVM